MKRRILGIGENSKAVGCGWIHTVVALAGILVKVHKKEESKSSERAFKRVCAKKCISCDVSCWIPNGGQLRCWVFE